MIFVSLTVFQSSFSIVPFETDLFDTRLSQVIISLLTASFINRGNRSLSLV